MKISQIIIATSVLALLTACGGGSSSSGGGTSTITGGDSGSTGTDMKISSLTTSGSSEFMTFVLNETNGTFKALNENGTLLISGKYNPETGDLSADFEDGKDQVFANVKDIFNQKIDTGTNASMYLSVDRENESGEERKYYQVAFDSSVPIYDIGANREGLTTATYTGTAAGIVQQMKRGEYEESTGRTYFVKDGDAQNVTGTMTSEVDFAAGTADTSITLGNYDLEFKDWSLDKANDSHEGYNGEITINGNDAGSIFLNGRLITEGADEIAGSFGIYFDLQSQEDLVNIEGAFVGTRDK